MYAYKNEKIVAPRFTIYEQRLERLSCKSIVAADFRESSFLTRQSLGPVSERENSLISVAAGVAGPILTSYVYWVLSQAASQRVKKLYFISRDGQILFKVAQRLNNDLRFPIELRYL